MRFVCDEHLHIREMEDRMVLRRKGAIEQGPVTQLPLFIPTPAHHGSIGHQRTGEAITDHHRGGPRSRGHLNGDGCPAIARRPIAELTVVVRTPTSETSILEEDA